MKSNKKNLGPKRFRLKSNELHALTSGWGTESSAFSNRKRTIFKGLLAESAGLRNLSILAFITLSSTRIEKLSPSSASSIIFASWQRVSTPT